MLIKHALWFIHLENLLFKQTISARLTANSDRKPTHLCDLFKRNLKCVIVFYWWSFGCLYLAASPEAWPPGRPGLRWPSCRQWLGWGPYRPGLQPSGPPSSPDRGVKNTEHYSFMCKHLSLINWWECACVFVRKRENIIWYTSVCAC